jgi:outer membrane protein assembly factor BamA
VNGQVNKIVRFILLGSLLLSAGAAQKQSTRGQPAANDAYKLVAVKVKGTSRYTDQEILAASGLQIGQPAGDGDFKEAVRRLGDSGMFSEVLYSYTASGTGVKIELQLADTADTKLVPARFENFVWFSDSELLKELQTRVPLFKQLLPLSGNLLDRVSEALQALLPEKHLPGRVDFLREEDESADTLSALVYRLEEVSIRIQGVEFPGASPDLTPLLTVAARRLIGAEYTRSALAAAVKFDLLPVYLRRGYLKAAFAPSDARVLPAATTGEQGPADIEVDAIVPVTPGKVYSTSSVNWKGISAITAIELAPLLHMPPGQPADEVRLHQDLENVTKLYRSRGYMTAQVKSEAQFDDEKSTVHYDLNVAEGDLYKMGELEITGLDTQAKARLEAAWTLHQGQPYDADYPKKFQEDTGSLLPRGIRWAVTVHESLDAKDKTVDVEIHFKQQ